MKTLFLTIFLLFASSNAFAHTCPPDMIHLDTAHVCMGFEFTEGPYINQRGERRLSSGIVTLDSFEFDLDISQSFFYLWMKMPNMEHGGRPLSITYLGDGQFSIENILLTRMPGQWFLRVTLEHDQDADDHEPSIDYDGEIPLTEWM